MVKTKIKESFEGYTAVIDDTVYKDYENCIRCAIEYGRLRFSAAECFITAVSFCRRIYDIGDTDAVEVELYKIKKEYDGDNDILTLSLLICRELILAVSQSKHYVLMPRESLQIRASLKILAVNVDCCGIVKIWDDVTKLVGTAFECNDDYSDYLLPNLVGSEKEKNDVMGIIENTLSFGNISECEALKNILLNFNRDYNNRYNPEIDYLINGIKELRKKQNGSRVAETNNYYSGSIHDDKRKVFSVNH